VDENVAWCTPLGEGSHVSSRPSSEEPTAGGSVRLLTRTSLADADFEKAEIPLADIQDVRFVAQTLGWQLDGGVGSPGILSGALSTYFSLEQYPQDTP
jgi:hypothetical protein